MPPWGRPSGAKGTRRRRQWEWEERQARVEEVDTDDTDTQGVGLDFGKEKRFTSDSLHFTGTDLVSSRVRRSYIIDESEGSSEDSDGSKAEGIDASEMVLRDNEEALVQSAMARIRRAQEKGRREVKLNQEELDALEKRRKRMQAAATAKERKGSGSSTGSGNEKKRRSKRTITIPLASAEPQSRSSSRRSSRRNKGKSKRSDDMPAPAFMVAGVDGLVYAPTGSSSQQPSPSRNSTSRSRASTNSQPTRSNPSSYSGYPAPGNQRNLSDGVRPASSASNRSRPLPDEEGWAPANSRRSSGSSSYIVDPFEYQVSPDAPPPIPHQYTQPQPSRYAVSSSQDVNYSSVRRTIPGAFAAAKAPLDSSLYQRRSRDEFAKGYHSSSEDESDDGNGVQVYVDREPERQPERTAVSRKPVGGSGSGKKKGRR